MRSRNDHRPPRAAERLMEALFPDEGLYSTLGDLEHVYYREATEKSITRARWWYWGQVVRAVPHYVRWNLQGSGAMFANYLKLALRTLRLHRGYTFINVIGLATGLACALGILLWVYDEVNYDRFHEQGAELYRVERDYGKGRPNGITPFVAAPAFEAQVPELVAVTRIGTFRQGLVVRYEDRMFLEASYVAVDPVFFEMFTFPFQAGSAAEALRDPQGLVLTATTAATYFGSESAIGKEVVINGAHVMRVTGVTDDPPSNSTVQFDMVVPFALVETLGWGEQSWRSNWVQTFVQVPQVESLNRIEQKLTDVMTAHLGERAPERMALMPLLAMHAATPGFRYVYIFSMLAVFVLVIACINFMNLSTAQAARRAKEVGMRKVVGALRPSLIAQFLGESLVLTFIALGLAVGLLAVLWEPFTVLSGKALAFGALLEGPVLLGIAVLALVTGLLAGSYPAFYLSAFRPVQVLKGRVRLDGKRGWLRQGLVIFQFGISVFLVIGMLVINDQLQYMQTKDLGYDREYVAYVTLPQGAAQGSYTTLKQEWERTAVVGGVSGAQVKPSLIGWSSYAEWDGKITEEPELVNHNRVDYGYVDALGLELVQGRPFSDARAGEATAGHGQFIINETMAQRMGGPTVVGKELTLGRTTGPIMGVVKDFHFQSLHTEIKPLALVLAPEQVRYAIVQVQAGSIAASLQALQTVWERLYSDHPFDYHFVDEDLDRMYRAEIKLADMLTAFSALAILIACLGLLGLVAYTTQERRKEIAVRKVLGASQTSITYLLCKEVLVLVVVANVLAWPLAGYTMNAWLSNFAYRTALGWEFFALAAVAATSSTLCIVSFQAIKAALANPIVALRYD